MAAADEPSRPLPLRELLLALRAAFRVPQLRGTLDDRAHVVDSPVPVRLLPELDAAAHGAEPGHEPPDWIDGADCGGEIEEPPNPKSCDSSSACSDCDCADWVLAAVDAGDWETAAKESHRNGIQQARNDETAALFRQCLG